MSAASSAPVPRLTRLAPDLRGLSKSFGGQSPPAALRPTARERVFQVAQVWGEDLLVDMEPVTSRGFTLLPFSESLGAHDRAPRVQQLANGDAVLILPVGARARIGRGESLKTPAELFAAGEATPVEVPVRGMRYVLGLEERIVVDGDRLRIVGRYLRPEGAPTRPFGDRLDVPFLTTAVMALLFLIFIGALLRVSLRLGPILSDDPRRNAPGVHFLDTPQRIVRQAVAAIAGDTGRVGHPNRDHIEAAPPHRGGSVAASHASPMTRAGFLKFFEGLMPTGTGRELGPSGGGNLGKALEGVHGPQIGDSTGTEGLGSRGPGTGGDEGTDPLLIGRIGGHEGGDGTGGRFEEFRLREPKHVAAPVSLVHVTDGLSKDVVGRVIQKHWNEIRYCYEKELSLAPNLAGKVAIAFRIGPVGDVISADIRESTLESSAVHECILANVRRWVFPHPAGDGVVDVSYPFLFDTRQ
jgi:hypothetical protein